MKSLILVFVTLFSFASQARSLAPDSSLQWIELSEGVKVLQINIQSQFGVNCPQLLDLNAIASYNENAITVSFDDDGSGIVHELISNVSNSCGSEIFDYQSRPRLQCMSFGIEHGTAFVSIEHLKAGSLMIAIPTNYELTNVVELK